ncbi:MAG: glutamate formimidoyltransferase [Oligoflexia bacterium]|nr:glutamate formimidoyltransferase [Oligoflexia bacterium]
MSVRKIVECVPNISNGVNPEVYNTIANSVLKVPGVKLLDVEPGFATNRTVITFAGSPEDTLEAAYQLFKVTKEMIDMRTHKGEHPRMGAVDVCPFVPISGVTMEECTDLAKRLARRVGEELGVWCYLYEHAASKAEWKNLANVRKGEYEGLKDREGKLEWKADFGPNKLDPKFGACAIGARKCLVAYNINVNSSNKKWAQDIAFNIRESGRSKRVNYPDGDIVRNADGTAVNVPGTFKNCNAMAWVIPEYNRAQITMNLKDTDETPLHVVFDEVLKQAHERGVRITGSEIVGLVPLQVLLDAGKYFLQKQGLSAALSEKELLQNAIISLGLNDVVPFDYNKKIIEYNFIETKGLLVQQRVDEFADTLASDAPAPGGGSVAALCGSLSAALAAMVTNLTHGKPQFREHWSKMEEIGIKGQELKAFFIKAIDSDTDAFNKVMAAMKMPQNNDEQKRERKSAIDAANKEATLIPLSVLEKSLEIYPLLDYVSIKGNPNCASDVGVGAHCMLAAAEGAALNVRINLKNINDQLFKDNCNQRMNSILTQIRGNARLILENVEKLMK